MAISEAYNMDCMEYMRSIPDKWFDLAIVDPDYGLGDKITQGGTWAKKYKKNQGFLGGVPSDEYFEELVRVSKNQIIWGGNYFSLPPNRCFVVWRKLSISESFTMAMCEYAWTSFDTNAKFIEHLPEKGNRFHPAQKPTKIYLFLLEQFAKPGDRILDTHLGSGSSRIAAYDMGYDFYATELDKDYFDQSCKRFETHKLLHGNTLFKQNNSKSEQTNLF
jgi:site-specific DNA-methyltransferase (adenine-specific)